VQITLPNSVALKEVIALNNVINQQVQYLCHSHIKVRRRCWYNKWE